MRKILVLVGRRVQGAGLDPVEVPARYAEVRHCSKPVDRAGLAEALFG